MVESIPVLVTAVGGSGVGEQILKALRLATEPYHIVAADVKSGCTQFTMADEAVTLPRADAPDYAEAVLHVCRRRGIRALFPGSEAELRALSNIRDRVEREGTLLAIAPDTLIDTCLDKEKTARFLSGRGFSPPRSVHLSGADDLCQIDWFPVVVKPISGGGSTNCFIAQTSRELSLLADYLTEVYGAAGFMVQEYVGTPDHEYTVGVLHDMNGRFVNSIALRRDLSGQLNVRMRVPNRTGKRELGPTLVISSGISHGEFGDFPAVTGPCEQIAAELSARGPINIQCRLVGGCVRVFEINPRFSGTTSLRAMMGYNEPDVLIRRHILGQEIPERFSYKRGTIFRSLQENHLSEQPIPAWSTL